MITEYYGKANEATFKTELAGIKEEYETFLMQKIIESDKFEQGTLNAGKNTLIYNTKPESETGNINTILKNTSEKYKENFEIIKGELIFTSQNKNELKWAEDLGIHINPYIIIDGELMSSDTNLMLMDENTRNNCYSRKRN